MKKISCKMMGGGYEDVSSEDLVFRVGGYVIISNDKDEVLMINCQREGIFYDLPGGGVEKGERLEVAAIREAKEESGYDVEIGDLVHVSDFFFKLRSDYNPWQMIRVFFTGRIIGGEPLVDGNNEDSFGLYWVRPSELNDSNCVSSCIEALDVWKKR